MFVPRERPLLSGMRLGSEDATNCESPALRPRLHNSLSISDPLDWQAPALQVYRQINALWLDSRQCQKQTAS